MTSADDILGMIVDRVPPALVSAGSLTRLRQRARTLPALADGGFECRLDDPARDPDFCLLGSVGDGGRELLDAWDAPVVRALTRSWDDDLLRTIGVEMDAPAWDPAGVFFTFRERDGSDPWAHARRAAEPLGVVPSGAVDAVLARLRAGVTVRTFGFMLGRAPTFVRLNVGGEVGADLPAVLRAIGWAGDLDTVVEHLRWIAPRVSFFVACLDMGEALGQRLGLECFFERPAPFVEALVERGLCTPLAAAGLLSWGCPWTPFKALGERVPAALRWMDAHTPGGLATFVNHIKVDFRGSEPTAKAYLAYRYRWRPAR